MTAADLPVPPVPATRPLNAPGLFVGVAIFGAAALGILAFTMLRRPQIPAVISLDYTEVAGSVIVADIARHEPRALADALAAKQSGAHFSVPDLSPTGFTLDGGTPRAVIGHAGILAIYRNALQDLVVWQQFDGSIDELPSTSDIRDRAGRKYFVHRKSTNVLVFWQDGSRVNVITSSLPSEQVVALAYSVS
jgi:hypothetical protein